MEQEQGTNVDFDPTKHCRTLDGRLAKVLFISPVPFSGGETLVVEIEGQALLYFADGRYFRENWSTDSSLVNVPKPRHHAEVVKRYFDEDDLVAERLFSFYVERCMNLDVTHEGYPNPATFLARLYIDNDAELLEKVLALRRKDGTINPERLRLAFHKAGMKVDDWAYEFHIDPPEGCEGRALPLEATQRLMVDWCMLAMIYGPKEKSK